MSATWPEGGKIVSPTVGAHATTRFETDLSFLRHGMEAKRSASSFDDIRPVFSSSLCLGQASFSGSVNFLRAFLGIDLFGCSIEFVSYYIARQITKAKS
jgi:hypothetical protein